MKEAMEDFIPPDRAEVFIPLLTGYTGCRDYIHSIFEKHSKNSEDAFLHNARNLVKYISERNIAITLLIQSNCLWDAQMLMRPVLEASMKLFFLVNSTEDERKERLREFLYDLEEINRIKQSDQAKKIVDAFKTKPELTKVFRPLILSDDQEKTLREKWPKKVKQKLE